MCRTPLDSLRATGVPQCTLGARWLPLRSVRRRARVSWDVRNLENRMHPAMSQLGQLPASERLHLVQDLWDSINESRDEMPIQDWHRELIKARLAEFDGREDDFGFTRQQIWRQVDERRGS